MGNRAYILPCNLNNLVLSVHCTLRQEHASLFDSILCSLIRTCQAAHPQCTSRRAAIPGGRQNRVSTLTSHLVFRKHQCNNTPLTGTWGRFDAGGYHGDCCSCVFHGFLPLSPSEGCHSVHVKPAIQSTGFLPPSPREACHVDHGKVATWTTGRLPPSERSDAGQ